MNSTKKTSSNASKRNTLSVCYVLKELENTSATDCETISKAFAVMDAFYATLKNPQEK
jgi:hypothetical protein